MRNLLFIALLGLTSCASFESRFTSHTGCPANEIKVLDNPFTLLGPKSYTLSCRGVVYHCTENFIEGQHSNLKCMKDQNNSKLKRKRASRN